MCFSTDTNENAVFILCTVLLTLSIFLMPFGKINFSGIICGVTIMLIVITLAVSDNKTAETMGPDVDVVVVDRDNQMLRPLASPRPRPRPYVSRACTAPQAPIRAMVPGNAIVTPAPAPQPWLPQNPNQQFGKGLTLLLPVEMETGSGSGLGPGLELELGLGPRTEIDENVPQCGQGFELTTGAQEGLVPKYKTVPNMPPFPGVVQYTGDTIWRLPEWPADQPSREESIAAVVSDLPTCSKTNPKDMIRNQGLYGIKGNVACDLLKRSAVADTGFLQPLGARNAFLAYNSYDQLHAKDQFLIPTIKQTF